MTDGDDCTTHCEVLQLIRWREQFDADDPNANLKRDVALYSHVDPLLTLRGLSEAVNIPVGALAHYVLARYATSGSGGMLELGPAMIERLFSPVDAAEAVATDCARLDAYEQLRALISWLRVPLVDAVHTEHVYGGAGDE